jgi:hypothetical protein
VLIALLGLAMLIAVFLATRNSQSESVTPPATPAKPAAPKTAAPKADKPARPETRQSQSPEPAKPAAPQKPKPAADVPRQVREAAAALEKNQVVVFFFHTPGPADDTGARVAVRSLERMKRVEVIEADLADVGAFRPMLSQLEISQVPATAIVRPGKQAVLLQGYVDAGTLRQNVADALR